MPWVAVDSIPTKPLKKPEEEPHTAPTSQVIPTSLSMQLMFGAAVIFPQPRNGKQARLGVYLLASAPSLQYPTSLFLTSLITSTLFTANILTEECSLHPRSGSGRCLLAQLEGCAAGNSASIFLQYQRSNMEVCGFLDVRFNVLSQRYFLKTPFARIFLFRS